MSTDIPPGVHGSAAPPRNGFGIASLALGIVQFPVGLFCVLGIICGALAIIFGWLGMGRASRGEATNGGQAKAGFILGIVGVVLALAFAAILIVVAASD